MKVLRHPLFICATALTLANAALERLASPIPFIHAYLDDVLCFPVVLTLALALLRMLKGNDHRLSSFQIGAAVIYFSIVFEWMLPRVSASYTGDALDVIAYAAGAMMFAVFINAKPVKMAASDI